MLVRTQCFGDQWMHSPDAFRNHRFRPGGLTFRVIAKPERLDVEEQDTEMLWR
jgi:hypothetical protein